YFMQRQLDSHSARALTVSLVGALEGAFTLARILHSAEPLREAGNMLAALAVRHQRDSETRPTAADSSKSTEGV
ncbi:hypothetical protein ACFVX3_33125, partial [Rhodococcus erythropolis]